MPISPRFSHHALAAKVEHVKADQGHVPAHPRPLREDGLDALVPVSRTSFPVKDGGLE